ncbi:MAG: hypothetical protein QGG71_23245 [Pirellulaceae bacterium]|nr:hypothetical protein [Pirellulaceae bacterium]
MIIAYILKVIVISWMAGHALTLILKRVISLNKLLQLNFIGNEKVNKLIGVGVLKWVLVNSFIKYFNRRLQISDKKPNLTKLIELREEMAYAETVHLIGFAYVMVRVFVNITNDETYSMNAALFAVNMIGNFYPVLLQQLNKRRIDRLLEMQRNRPAAIATGRSF